MHANSKQATLRFSHLRLSRNELDAPREIHSASAPVLAVGYKRPAMAIEKPTPTKERALTITASTEVVKRVFAAPRRQCKDFGLHRCVWATVFASRVCFQ
jgi:hypothetical protein